MQMKNGHLAAIAAMHLARKSMDVDVFREPFCDAAHEVQEAMIGLHLDLCEQVAQAVEPMTLTPGDVLEMNSQYGPGLYDALFEAGKVTRSQ